MCIRDRWEGVLSVGACLKRGGVILRVIHDSIDQSMTVVPHYWSIDDCCTALLINRWLLYRIIDQSMSVVPHYWSIDECCTALLINRRVLYRIIDRSMSVVPHYWSIDDCCTALLINRWLQTTWPPSLTLWRSSLLQSSPIWTKTTPTRRRPWCSTISRAEPMWDPKKERVYIFQRKGKWFIRYLGGIFCVLRPGFRA